MKRKAKAPTTKLTRDYCEERGIRTTKVEHFEKFSQRYHDAFGFGDVLAIDGAMGALLIQCTTTDNMSSRIVKICTECEELASMWLHRGNRIMVIGWSKRPDYKTKRITWQPTFVRIGFDNQGLYHHQVNGLIEPEERTDDAEAADDSRHAGRSRSHQGTRRGNRRVATAGTRRSKVQGKGRSAARTR